MIDKEKLATLRKEASIEVSNFTMPLFFKNNKSEAEFASSSILFTHKNRYFIITATHTVERFPNNLHYYYKDEIMPPLIGDWTIILRKEAEFSKDSNIEAAILEINLETAKEITNNSSFITIDDISTHHKIHPQNIYFLVGYPTSKTKLKYGTTEIRGVPLFYFDITCFDDDIFKKLNVEKYSHILLKYEQNNLLDEESKKITGPFPKGCSGCGLWLLSNQNYILRNRIIPKLAGLFIEYHENGINTLVSLRFHIIMEILNQKYRLNLKFENFTQIIV